MLGEISFRMKRLRKGYQVILVKVLVAYSMCIRGLLGGRSMRNETCEWNVEDCLSYSVECE